MPLPVLPSPIRFGLTLFAITCGTVLGVAAAKPLDNDFIDHGVAAPISSQRGIVATIDAEGRNVALVWLMDHRGGYALLLIDAATGKTEQFPLPSSFVADSPYASILSSRNKFYTLFSDHFIEFDVVKRAFTFVHRTTPRAAMGMTEDDQGVIWAVNYPQSGVVSFDPRTAVFRDYGNVYPRNWAQYQRAMAADDAGWIYFGLGMTESQIIALDPASGKATPLLAENEQRRGSAYVYRDLDGKVYGQALRGPQEEWSEFYQGKRRKLTSHTDIRPKPIVTGDQGLFHARFPNGDTITNCDLVSRKLTVTSKDATITTVSFDYTTDGAQIMGVAAASNGTICGGTMFPFRFFSFTPTANTWNQQPAWYQWNTLATQGGFLFVGGYPGGFLLEWDPTKPWLDTQKNQEGSNPAYLTDCTPIIHRPNRLFAYPDAKTIIMGGGPQYGYTGGGLLFWDRVSRTRIVLTDKQVIPDHSTLSLVALPEGQLLGGTTTEPGTGGEKKAKEAVLYTMDLATKTLVWRASVLPGVQKYTDLWAGPSGMVFGIADRKIFFVFDPSIKSIVYKKDVSEDFGLSAAEQGPRVFVPGGNGSIYVLFQKGVTLLDTNTFNLKLIAPTPVDVEAGGAYLDGRVYFTNGSHLCSVSVR
jgi:hypothetical protein